MCTWGFDTEQYSAFAAIFSAITSFVAIKISIRNRFDSIKPTIVISKMHRPMTTVLTPNNQELILLKEIKNIGTGHAYNVIVTLKNSTGSVSMPNVALPPFIEAGRSVEINGELILSRLDYINNICSEAKIVLYYWDGLQKRHTSSTTVLIYDARLNIEGARALDMPHNIIFAPTRFSEGLPFFTVLSNKLDYYRSSRYKIVAKVANCLARFRTRPK